MLRKVFYSSEKSLMGMKSSDFSGLLELGEVRYRELVRLEYRFQGKDYDRSGYYYGTFSEHSEHRSGILVSDLPGDLKSAKEFDFESDEQKYFVLKKIMGAQAYHDRIILENKVSPLDGQ